MSVPRLFMLIAACLATPLLARGQSQIELTPVQELWSSSFQSEGNRDYDRALSDVAKINHGDHGRRREHLCESTYYLKKDYTQTRKAYRVAGKSSPGDVSPRFGLIDCDVAGFFYFSPFSCQYSRPRCNSHCIRSSTQAAFITMSCLT